VIHALHFGGYWIGIGLISAGMLVVSGAEMYHWRRHHKRRRPLSLGELIQTNALNGFEKRQ
jgi:hypothetical protein